MAAIHNISNDEFSEHANVVGGKGVGQEYASPFGTAHGTEPGHPAYAVDRALGSLRRIKGYKATLAASTPSESLDHAASVIEAGSQMAQEHQVVESINGQ